MSVRIIERLNEGLTHAEYLAHWRASLETPIRGLDREARKRLHYIRYNFERQERVAATYRPSDELLAAAACIDRPQLWMLLTEDWCGDSAYAMPIIRAAAAASDHVELRILRRDEHPDIMDRHLTGGSRSIPKLVSFDMNGEELFAWGPRPERLQRLRQQLVDEGLDGREVGRRVIEWYDAGNWLTIDGEIAACIGCVAEPVP